MIGVVIVDDEPWSREVVLSLGEWEDLGLEVRASAGSGEEAMAAIRKFGPRIVVTDMKMDGVDGPALLESMARARPRIYAIVASGYDDFRYTRQAVRSGAVEYLLKPIDPEALNAALRHCVGRIEREAGHRDADPPLGSGAGFLLESPALLDRYIAIRRGALAALESLDRAALKSRFADLAALLREAEAPAEEEAAAAVARDFLLGLEELRFSSGPAGKAAAATLAAEPIKLRSLGEAIEAIEARYLGLLEEGEGARKAQGRVDIDDLRSFLDRHFREGPSLDKLAARCNVSKEHLCRTFKAATGSSIGDYLTARRMEEARRLIEERGLAIKDAAECVGYTDLGYFYRVFKRSFGRTPGELRRQ